MLTLFILFALLSTGIFLVRKEEWDLDVIGFFLIIITGLGLLVHTILWSTAAYNYKLRVAERESLALTLSEARKNGEPLERAAAVQTIAEFNKSLAVEQYNSTTILLGAYFDARLRLLQPIK